MVESVGESRDKTDYVYTIQMSEMEHDAVEHFVRDFGEWILHAIENKIRRRYNAILINNKSIYNPQMLTKEQKEVEIAKLTLESRVDRDAREEIVRCNDD